MRHSVNADAFAKSEQSFMLANLRKLLTAFALLMVLPVQAARLALVMGNDNYASVSKLQKAGNDATAMSRELTSAGFAVQLHRDLNYRAMVRAVETFTAGIPESDEVVVFFAGHDVKMKSGAYLLPTDALGPKSPLSSTAIGAEYLSQGQP
jgi:hypothetical protein